MSEEPQPATGPDPRRREPPPGEGRPPRRLAHNFRWRAFFEHCADAVFLLDRRRRLLFVNRAWEALTGVSAERAAALVCRRPRPTSANDPPEQVLAHALTPPREVRRGHGASTRRSLPGPGPAPRWGEVEFLPLWAGGEQGGFLILGRIRPCASGPDEAGAAPLPERLADVPVPLPERLLRLRERRAHRYGLELWSSPLPAMRRVAEQVRLAAPLAVPVLLVGEPGTGKQTLARTIHSLGPRRGGAFAALDCAGLPPAAVAAVLFGERGAAREGVATIYLREPGRLPRDLQLRLCELIARSGDPEGGAPRILAGSAAALAPEVKAGRLLEEMACLLGTLVIDVPPLRERLDDLPALVERLLARIGEAAGEAHARGLSADSWEVVRGYPWPGNVGELYAILRAAAARAEDRQITAADLPAVLRQAQRRALEPPAPAERPLPLEQLLEQAERRLIELALRRTGGHKARAARLLSIPRPRLFRRMKVLGIADASEKEAE
jgi:transcriptional regulator with PAS, ATPase and Fis domain